jgi:uncharacterized protein YbjT (DUF2867 family)
LEKQSAIVFGSTGLIGQELLQLLIDDDDWKSAGIFLRQALPITSEKIQQHVTNFDYLEKYAHLIKGDVLFICLGTTLKSAGSKAAFRAIDYHLVEKVASFAKENNVGKMIFVSSIGASINSSNYYLQTKGRIEKKLEEMGFEDYYFLRPSILLGKRKNKRPAEKMAKILMRFFKFALVGRFRKYRGIHARDVAYCMNYLGKNGYQKNILESEDLQHILQAQKPS